MGNASIAISGRANTLSLTGRAGSATLSGFVGRAVEDLPISLSFVAVDATGYGLTIAEGGSIALGFAAVPVSGFDLAIVEGEQMALGFAAVAATGFDITLEEGGAAETILLGFAAVDATGFDLAIAEGEQISLGFSEVSVSGYDISVVEGDQIALGFGAVDATGFDLSIVEGEQITLGFEAVTVTGYDLSIAEGASFVQALYNLDDLTSANGGPTLTNTNGTTFTAGKNGNAATFVAASGQRLNSTDDFFKNVGDESFTLWFWLKVDSLGSGMGIAGQGNTRYQVSVNTDGTIRWRVNGVNLDSVGTISTDTWYFIVVEHNADTNELTMQINGGTVETATMGATTPAPGTNTFTLGSIASGSNLDGQIDGFGMRREGLLSSGEKATYYNSGAGVEF